jgi:hypothetical protein
MTPRTRVEAWQRGLRVGNHFLVIVESGRTIYGVVRRVPTKRDPSNDRYGEPDVRWVRSWSRERPMGLEHWIDVSDIDFPLTPSQFMFAKSLEWPATQDSLKVILRMQPMDTA